MTGTDSKTCCAAAISDRLPVPPSPGALCDRAPDGRLVDDLIVFGSPDRGGVVAKGFWLEPPDLRGASIARLNAFQDQVRGLLALIAPGRRLQLQWSCDADYRAELLRYHAATQGVSDPLVRRTRNERFMRYWQRDAVP
jgi:hypothetical protein